MSWVAKPSVHLLVLQMQKKVCSCWKLTLTLRMISTLGFHVGGKGFACHRNRVWMLENDSSKKAFLFSKQSLFWSLNESLILPVS